MRLSARRSLARRCATLCLCLVLLVLALGSCAKRSTAPALDDIYDEVVSLIERSYAVNDVVLGHGLPTWEIGSDYAERMRMYPSNSYADYENVAPYAPYTSIGELKQAMEEVYSSDYLSSIYVTLFDGFVGATGVVRAQLAESEGGLRQSVSAEPLLEGRRIYDYSTMRIVSPSSADYVTVELESHLEHEADTLTVRLGLTLERDGWRLDTPTY